MFYIIAKFSFDSTKNVFGPYKTEDIAWKVMENMADKEYQISLEENPSRTHKIFKEKDALEIAIRSEHCMFPTDITEFFIIEIEK